MAEPARITEPPPSLAEKLAAYQRGDIRLGEALQPERPEPRGESPEEAAERRALAHAHRVARWEARRPVMYADAATADLEDARIVEWLDRADSYTLVLAGPIGVGKTHAAYAIGNQAVHHRGQWVEAWTVTDLLEDLRPGGGGAPGIRECELLVLDDLGAQNASDWAIEQMTSLVDARIRDAKRQIVTTNAPYDALVATWGGRLMDRLRYRMTAVTIEGESRRGAAW